jgi:protease-4
MIIERIHDMKKSISIAVALVVALFCAGSAGAVRIPSYYQHLDFNLTSPGAFTDAAGGYFNPSVYSMMPGAEAEVYWSNFDEPGIGRWGLFTGMKNLGFGLVHNQVPGSNGQISVTDYHIALSGGTRDVSAGFGFGWSGGHDEDLFDRQNLMQFGLTWRLNHFLSLGGNETWGLKNGDRRELVDLAVRPVGNDRFTVFGDLETDVHGGDYSSNIPWSTGAMIEVPAGLKLIGRYQDSKDTESTWSLALAYSFGGGFHQGVMRGSVNQHFDHASNTDVTTWGVRLGYPEKSNLTAKLHKNSGYLSMNPRGGLVYSRYRFFDQSLSLQDFLDAIDDARTDDRISGIALNLSGSSFTRGQAWEIRERLADFKASGKHVVVFVDEAQQSTYYIASVADHIVMDPEGTLLMPGYVLGRTYVASMLEKLGVGFEEFRFLKYKSAVENFARHDMSAADREQRQALVDEFYTTYRDDVARSRNVTPATVEHWMNDQGVFTASVAMENKLVDELGRWDEVKQAVKKLEGNRQSFVGTTALADRWYPSKQWGEPDKIAIVYAIGDCEMDSGINARRLERILKGLRDQDDIKAVVVRVDSPGGSPMASDVVAGQMRELMKRKPVVVSQGDVAASGGYWLSMCSHAIVSEPTSITGSIGVIAGWVWDKGIGKKTGMEGDFVKKGDHADVFFSLRPPYLPPLLAIPHRAVDDEERNVVYATMKELYARFVSAVATNRKMDKDKVESLAQGRVWTGDAAKENGLIDRIGGLEDAVMLAREMAKIPNNSKAEIVEYAPQRGLFKMNLPFPGLGASVAAIPALFSVDWSSALMASLSGASKDATQEENEDYGITYLRHMIKYNGRAQCMISPDMIPQEEGQ